MTIRTSITDASRRAQSSFNRCTIREYDDDHDIMEAKTCDVGHSESPTGVQIHWPAGMTTHPMPQEQDQNQQQKPQNPMGGSDPDVLSGLNENQPKGASAIGHMSYYMGSRSNPVMGSIDDPRNRPYQTKPGESLYYAADGHGSCMYHRRRQDGNDGTYLVVCDGNDQQQGGGGGAGQQAGQQQTTRKLRIGHVNKKRQKRKKQQQGQQGQGGGGGQQAANGGGGGGQQEEQYKHEGDSVNTQTHYSAQKIEHFDGSTEVAHYDRGNKDWIHHDGTGAHHSKRADKVHTHIRHDADVWVAGGCFKSMPFVIKPDPCQ